MSRFSRLNGVLVAVAIAAMWAVPAQAQATRTWISGVGDDVNPCSRTAPCKTFAGAISKTAAGGEIDVLDPGGFGAVTITKSMTLDGSGGSTAGVLVSGQNGMVINDGGAGTAQVTIRNIDFEGIGFSSGGSGIRGIWFISGAALNVQHCSIRNFRDATNGTGIAFLPSTAARLDVDDTILTGNGNTGVGGGIVIQPTGSGSAKAVLNHVRAEGNTNNGLNVSSIGLSGGLGSNVSVIDSSFSGNTTGIIAIAIAGTAPAVVFIQSSIVANNSGTGVFANGTSLAHMYLGNTAVTNNNTGLSVGGTAIMNTFGNNNVAGNGAGGDGTPTLPALTPK